jgi:ubiquinone/menaquinone biosynthesis C-methylase UbiE
MGSRPRSGSRAPRMSRESAKAESLGTPCAVLNFVEEFSCTPELRSAEGRFMSYDKRQAICEFGGWSANYDRSILQWLLFRPAHRAIIARIRARFADQPITVLDVGCGTGVLAARIRGASPHAKVWGLDLVAAMLAKGRSRWRAHPGHLAPVQGDSERLPFPDGVFDVITCANSFHHYPHQERAVEEMCRVLKPGGRLILVDGSRDKPWGWFIYDVCVARVEGDVRHASAHRVRALFARAGLVETTQEVHRGLAPFLLTEGVARPIAKDRAGPARSGRSGPSISREPAFAGSSFADNRRAIDGARVR